MPPPRKDLGLQTAAAIFGIVALVHLVRLFTGFTVTIGTWSVPLWVSGVAAVGAGVLAIWLFRLSRS